MKPLGQEGEQLCDSCYLVSFKQIERRLVDSITFNGNSLFSSFIFDIKYVDII